MKGVSKRGSQPSRGDHLRRVGLCRQLCFCCWSFAKLVGLYVTSWTAARQASLSFTNSRSLLKLLSIEWMMPSNHLIFCYPLLLPSTFPSIRVFSSESVLYTRWLKYWSFSFSISPSNEYSGLISFRIDWRGSKVLSQPPDLNMEELALKSLSRLGEVP